MPEWGTPLRVPSHELPQNGEKRAEKGASDSRAGYQCLRNGVLIPKSKGTAVISVGTSKQETEPSRAGSRVGESKVFSGESWGKGRFRLTAPMPSTEVCSH